MNRFMPLALFASLVLAGCGQASEDTALAPDGKPGIAVAEARLVLPAVKGNPGAAYFNVFNGNDKTVSLVAVTIEGAGRSEMHDSSGAAMEPLAAVEIRPTWTQRLRPGSRHVMAFDLAENLAAGGETEMTLTFADGDKFSTELRVEAAGGMEDGH